MAGIQETFLNIETSPVTDILKKTRWFAFHIVKVIAVDDLVTSEAHKNAANVLT